MSDPAARLNSALEGRYRIDRELGEGGMATVYLAEDVRHDRKVALKVLKPELAAVMGAERFLSEIRTTANLQHPHILALFDSGEADGFLFFVMPFVDGETLQELIDREKQLSLDEAVGIATKVAQALDYAHRHGVVHRDIKPANILLHEGEPVVADFGIALAVQEAGGGRLTETGLSLGTPYYMSPEQATGDRVPDARADVYSLGSVLYEMLTGEPPYQGKTAQSVLGKILTGDITPPTAARKSIPPHVAAVVMKALERLPADRFGTAGAMAESLSDPTFRHATGGVTAASAGPAGIWRPLAIVTSAAAVVLAILLVRGPREVGIAPTVLRLSVPVPDSAPLLNPEAGASVQISADGSTLAYVALNQGTRQLFIRRREELSPRPLANTSDVRGFFLSPTGDEAAFLRGTGQALFAVRTESAVVRTVTDTVADFSGDWTSDGWIYFQNRSNGISRVSSAGGQPETMTSLDDANGGHTWVDVLPGGESAIFTVWGATAASDSVATIDFESGTITKLVEGVMGRFAKSGHLIYATNQGQLMAAPFDPEALALGGSAIPILDGVRIGANGEGEFSLSETGTLVYRAGAPGGSQQLIWMDREGGSTVVDSAFVADISDPALSPDGNRAAFIRTVAGRGDIWYKRLDRVDAPAQRLTFEGDGEDIRRPAWSADGTLIYYAANKDGDAAIMARNWDGTGDAVVALRSDSLVLNEVTASPDGAWLVVRHGANPVARDIVGYRIGVDTVPIPLAATTFDERSPSLSPDGRWLAYVSNQAGGLDIYVRPFPEADSGIWRISSDGGTVPVWGPDGKELFYKTSNRQMMVAELTFSDGVSVVSRKELFGTGTMVDDPTHAQYVVHPDGSRILTVWRGDDGETPLIWIEHFDKLLLDRVGEERSR